MSALTAVERNYASFLTVREYARAQGIDLSTAYRRVWSGQVAAEKFLGRWMVRDIEPFKSVRERDEVEAQPLKDPK